MTLHEAIEKVLKENNRPMTAKVIASTINEKKYYTRTNRELVSSNQILARIKIYPSLFQNINGHIVLVEDNNWKNLLTSYWYLVNLLKGIFIVADTQFIIAVIFFYKRLVDINLRAGRRYPLDFEEKSSSSFEKVFTYGSSFIEDIISLEDYHIAPKGIFEECSRLLSKLDKYKNEEIWSVIKNIQTKELDDKEFGNIYEYFITLDSLDKYKSAINHTPFSLKELMVNLLDPKSGTSIYDPVAGTGGLLIEAILHRDDNRLYAKGSEINERAAQLGNMNLMMHGMLNIEIEATDCFEKFSDNKKFDYIIADLPANGITTSIEHSMLYHKYYIEPPKKEKGFGSFILLVLDKLKSDGKAVITVSDGFLIKKGKEKVIRDLLVDQDIIESIISLPYGTLRPYSDAKASILVLNKSKPIHLRNKVLFIKAIAINQDKKSINLNTEEIIQTYHNIENISKYSQIIDNDDIRSDINLSVDAYEPEFMLGSTMMKEGIARHLSELVEIKLGMQPDKIDIDKDGDIPLVKVENLSKDILDLTLTKEINYKVNSNFNYSKSIISQECILIARIGDSLKPTLYRPSSEVPKILPHGNVYALIPSKNSQINIEYLYYQLHSSFVLEQIEKRRWGSVMPYLSIAGLKQVVIPLIDFGAQKSFVESQKANLIAEERLRVEDRIRALGYKEEVKQTESDVIKTLTHQLRPSFLGIYNVVNRLTRIIERENLINLKEFSDEELVDFIDPEISEHTQLPDNYSLKELLTKLSNDSKHLSEILSNVDKVMNFKLSKSDLKEINVLEFLKQYQQQKEIEINQRYSIIVKGDSIKAFINGVAFKELLDQLLLNAEKHGFILVPPKSYRVQFNIKYIKQREVISIEYINNGAPFNLSQKDFISAFEKGNQSTGSGIGGNYIYRIIEAHNGKIIVKENYKKGFLLTIELPSIKNQDYE